VKRDDSGTDVFLSMVDLNFDPSLPAGETLSLRISCTNRELPAQLPFGGEHGDLEIEGGAPVKRIRFLRKPTPTLRPALRQSAQWRLISHLSLNYLSLVEQGREALLEILNLYNFTDSPAVRKQIGGISAVASAPVFAKIGDPVRASFVRGTEVSLAFDEDEFVGTGVYMFAAVLERFLGLYAALNSFVQLNVTTKQREKPLKQWPPRAGDAILL
jgi:type VI secretion system protein ImpG